MQRYYPTTYFPRILVPIIFGLDYQAALAFARGVAGDGRIVLKGFVFVNPQESLSAAAMQARQVRSTLNELAVEGRISRRARVRVSNEPWAELQGVVQSEQPDLLVLQWPGYLDALGLTAFDSLANPPCDLALVRGPLPDQPANVLIPVRGGPFAELALRVSLSLAGTRQSSVTSLHLLPSDGKEYGNGSYRGISQVLANLPEVDRQEILTDDPAAVILAQSRQYDLVVMGATGRWVEGSPLLGPVTQRILEESPAGVVVVKTQRPLPVDMSAEEAGQYAISILVDRWFAENTFHAEEFADLDYLLHLKQKQGLTISLALPSLNEEATVGKVLETVKGALMERVPLLDEIVLMDSDSTDRTRTIAKAMGVPVFIHQEVLPQYGARPGKGEALWKSLYVTRGDILVWIDTDIVNIHPRFVYGLLGPLLYSKRVQFIKGFYRRPLRVGDRVQAGGGGRVTELTARPLLNLFYPELSGVVQPLSGEYGGRRSALEQMPFFSGYGVEIGLLIDALQFCGLNGIAQVDLSERIHHNQPLESLSKMSFAVIQAVIRKLEGRYERNILEEINKTMKLIRYEQERFFLDVVEIAERERPAMLELPEYRQALLQ